MKNKIGKLLVFAILGFLASTISVHALSYDVTDSSSFDAMMKDYIEDSTQSVYVIGSYVFTEDYTFTTQDMMLAALSIDLSEVDGERIAPSDSYDKMTIFKLERQYDASYNPTGEWKVAENFLGTDTLKENKIVDVTYVDYKKVQGKSSLSVNLVPTADMKTDLQKYGYDVVLENQKDITAEPSTDDPRKIMLGGTIYYLPEIDNWAQDKKTGYYIAFEIKMPDKFKGKAQWWLEEDNKLTHDSRNYAVVGLSKEANSKTFEVWVDFDGDGEEYEPACYTFDYSAINFVAQASKATLSATTEDQTVKGVYASALNIQDEDFVHIDENNKITGDIHYNPDVTVLPEDKTDYYIPVVVTIDKKYADTATFTTVNGDRTKTGTFKESADNTDKNILALLFAVKADNTDKTFTVTIDLDGEGTDFEPVDYVFDYTEANFLEAPTANVSMEGTEENQEEYAKIIDEQFDFKGNQKTLKFDVTGDNVTLTGQLFNEKYPFNGKGTAVDGYYFQYVIEISGDAKDTTITIPAKPGDPKTIKYGDYDFKNVNGKSGIVVLHKLNADSEDKKFEVTVDLDGNGTTDKTYEFDYTNLTFAKSSEVLATVGSNNVSSGDKTTFESWGFPEEAYSLTTIENNVVKGTIPYIDNISTSAFSSEADRTGNYMIYTIELADVNKEGKAEVKLSCTTGANCKDGWKIVKPKSSEDLSILHSVKQNEDGSIKDIVAYVDLDGFENNEVSPMALDADAIYLPYEIRLTFDENIVVQKKSDVSVEKVTNETNPGLKDWMSNHANIPNFNFDNYEVSTTGNTVKITGTAHSQKTNDGNLEYYVAYKFVFDKKYENIEITKANGEVITQQNTSAWDGGTDGKEMTFVTKLTSSGDKKTTFKIDLDGSKGQEYSQIEYTIDYSEVELAVEMDTELDETTLSNLKSFVEGFEGNNEDFAIEGNKMTGSVTKKETYFNGKDNDPVQGYFIGFVLHIPGLTKDSKVIVGNTEMVPYDTKDDKDPGYAIVFQLNDQLEEKKFTISIDLDGEGAGEPVIYEYDYSDLQFKTEQTVANFASTSTTTPNASYSISETGKISGAVKETEDDKKYHFNVTVAPQNVSEKTTVEVTDPNGKVTTYAYQGGEFVANTAMNVRKVSRRRSQLLTISNPTLTLDLEALIDVENRVYKITIDADGDGELYDPITYDIDYSELKLGDIENVTKAFEKTAELKKVKLESKSSTNAYDRYTRYYDKDANKRWSIGDNGEESYTYSLVGAPYIPYKEYNALDRHDQPKYYVDNFHKVSQDAEWQYHATLYSGMGIPGLSLLNNVTTVVSVEEKPVDAPEGYVYYDVILDKDTVNEWLKNNYGSTPENVRTVDSNQTVHIAVDEDGIIRSIKAHWKEDNGQERDINVEITDMAEQEIEWPDTGRDNDYWLNVWAEKHLGLNGFKTVEEAVAYRKAYWSQD